MAEPPAKRPRFRDLASERPTNAVSEVVTRARRLLDKDPNSYKSWLKGLDPHYRYEWQDNTTKYVVEIDKEHSDDGLIYVSIGGFQQAVGSSTSTINLLEISRTAKETKVEITQSRSDDPTPTVQTITYGRSEANRSAIMEWASKVAQRADANLTDGSKVILSELLRVINLALRQPKV